MPKIIGLWLRVRNARLGALLLGALTALTSVFAGETVPAPLAFIESTALKVPIGSLAPTATAMAIGYLLQYQLPSLERTSLRPVAVLDAALLAAYSIILLSPSVLFVFDRDAAPVFAACRVQLFALWATIVGAQIIGTRFSVVAVTAALLLAPTLLPAHLRSAPPGVFVTLAAGSSGEAAIITASVALIGIVSVAWRGLPGVP